MRIINLLSLLTVVFYGLSCSNNSTDEPADRGYIVDIGHTPENIEFNLTDGTTINLDQLKGKVVVLQFTASWCSVCRKEMPHLEKDVWQRFKDDEFILIGVDYDEPMDEVVAFKKQMKTTYPMSLDPDAEIFSKFAYKKSGVTRNIVLDKKGEIVFLTRLFEQKEFDLMVSKIEELLRQ